MTQTASIRETDPCIFVIGPPWHSQGHHDAESLYGHPRAEFYGRWLLAAAKAEEVWKKVKEEPRYEKQLEQVPIDYRPSFGSRALWLMSQLSSNSYSAIVRLDNSQEEMLRWFVIMGWLNFFQFPKQGYRMSLPHRLGMGQVKIAVVAGFLMGDDKYREHPRYAVPSTMTYAEAQELQRFLIQNRAGRGRPEYSAPATMTQRLH